MCSFSDTDEHSSWTCVSQMQLNSRSLFIFSRFFQAFPDNAVRREVENLPAVCINESCTWKGSIKEYEVRRLFFLHLFFSNQVA